MSDFRSTSLLNMVYNEILTTRLNSILNNLIDIAQSGFIKGRFVLNETAYTQEFMSPWKRQKEMEVYY